MKLIIRKNELKACVGISPATATRLEKAGIFPRRRRITPDLVGWSADELRAWCATRPVATDGDGMRGEATRLKRKA